MNTIKEALAAYWESPNKCKHCDAVMPVPRGVKVAAVRRKKFCNHSCAARYNNPGRARPTRPCAHCGSPTRNPKFCSPMCSAASRQEQNNRKIEEDGAARSTRGARNYLLATRPHRCEICGVEEWTGRPVPLVCDHIDGNPTNHKLDNLRIICPNCDALLSTYKGRNKGNGRAWRRERYAAGKSY